jgi:hypothetical protein
MRAIKVLTVAVTMAASLLAGVAVTMPAASGAASATRWCC